MSDTAKFYEDEANVDRLKNLIIEMSLVAWDNRIVRPLLDRWLSNFDGHVLHSKAKERIVALWMMMNFTFYTEKEVRELCKCVFNDYIHNKLLEYEEKGLYAGASISDVVNTIVSNTLFLPLGNPSESGTSLLYYFRQENGLSKKSFDVVRSNYENIVFVDDITITGTQANDYVNEVRKVSADNLYFLSLIASDKAIQFLNDHQPNLQVLCAIFIDDRSKCFTQDSFVFQDEEFQKMAYEMCLEYGKLLYSECPLGYDNSQEIFGLYYNTPDNTLPIMWSNRRFDINNVSFKWTPAFYRYNKIYGKGRLVVNESKFL